MNVYALENHVVFAAHLENRGCTKGLLKNQKYTVERTEVGRSSTRVYLKEIPGKSFNSTIFVDGYTQTELNDRKHADYLKFN